MFQWTHLKSLVFFSLFNRASQVFYICNFGGVLSFLARIFFLKGFFNQDEIYEVNFYLDHFLFFQ